MGVGCKKRENNYDVRTSRVTIGSWYRVLDIEDDGCEKIRYRVDNLDD